LSLFQAGLGYISGITSPKYDKQQDIYTDLLNELSDAASKLKRQPPTIPWVLRTSYMAAIR